MKTKWIVYRFRYWLSKLLYPKRRVSTICEFMECYPQTKLTALYLTGLIRSEFTNHTIYWGVRQYNAIFEDDEMVIYVDPIDERDYDTIIDKLHDFWDEQYEWIGKYPRISLKTFRASNAINIDNSIDCGENKK